MPAAPALIRVEVLSNWHNRGAVSRVTSHRVVSRHAGVVPAAAVLVAASDPRSSRVVYAMVIGLVVVGVALVLLGVWIMRQTRPDLEVLAPLERMGDGEWKKRDPSTQRRMLDEVRPDGAVPLTPEPMPPPVDADFGADHPVSSFSDLGPGIVAEQRDPTPIDSKADPFDIEPEQAESADDEALSDPRG
ncbi:MAG TPA: hypothetical protein VLN74_01250 [Ilumatobacteraceae bacterium]|nr:hypothetical protein [Ilumatobacteraceae bacterium]